MILIAANAISKILGAVFKIPLAYILQEEGMAIFNTAFQVYIMVLSFIISGIPLAISKMVAENMALLRENEAHKIIRVSEILLAAIGTAGSLILFFGAGLIASLMKDPETAYSIKAVAPAIFFVALGVVYKSYYQGVQNMFPTAVSQVVEAVIKLAAGYALAIYFINHRTGITSAAATFGVTIGEIVATFILLVMYLPHKRKIRLEKASVRTVEILREIAKIAVPLIGAAGVSSILSVIDIAMIRARLQAINFTAESAHAIVLQYSNFTHVFDKLPISLKMGEEGARWLYGAYSGYALTIFHLPVGIVGTFGISILPVIAGAFALGDMKKASRSTQLAIRISLLVAFPCASGMLMLSKPMLYLLFRNTASAPLLSAIAPCVPTVCIVTITTAILQAAGKIMPPFRNMLVGMGIKLILTYVLVGMPQFNIMGAPISSNVEFLVVAVLNLCDVKKVIGVRYDLNSIILKPVVATVVMSVVMYMLYEPMCIIFANEIGGLAATVAAGSGAYVMMLVLLQAITWEEIGSLIRRI
ncbi:MAG: polysaccharide biosynthesis protein [Clostridia bacterium]|nr:polysaccharide biosynthesis protein [Clostridia bacterium]